MPIAILLVGAVFLIAAIRDKQTELGDLLKEQFTGAGSFTQWLFALLLIGLLGSVQQLRPLARAFLILVIIVMILVNSRSVNLLTQIQTQLLGGAGASASVKKSAGVTSLSLVKSSSK